MTKKKNEKVTKKPSINAYIAGAGIVVEQPITQTLEKNYMPYAMSVIVSRALPEIDGFKPSHRKLLYTMYKLGLINGTRIKSANIVGRTMQLNPHGDQTIYDTMVRLSRGYEALLHPYVDSKGNFGKAYSRDMAYAASRYTEAKLSLLCNELFRDIDKDTVDFIPNYDNTMVEPVLLPTTFPAILVNSNVGIAVSMASSICPFNLTEICETTIAMLKDPDHNIAETLKGADFPSGGYILYDKEQLDNIINTGRASIKVRSKYIYDKQENCIEILELPSTTTIEASMDKIIELVKLGKIKDITDIRDETDKGGLKLAIDLKRGVDPDKLMQRLFKSTPLQDNFSCNFNILIAGYPRVMGVREILTEWIAFRSDCVKRRVYFDLKKKNEKLHLLQGLEKILLDIDKAIHIVRQTDEEAEVIPNLMIGFSIDEIQADYIAEIKLRHLNKEYILKRTQEIAELLRDIAILEDILKNQRKIRLIIADELKQVIEKYAQPRKTEIIFDSDVELEDDIEEISDHNVHIFVTRDGYFKKISLQSLRMSGEQKLKDTDEVVLDLEVSNASEMLVFTDKFQVYKTKVSDFEDSKASLLGDFLPAKLLFDPDEKVIATVITKDYSGSILFFFDNGRIARVPLSSYETKQNRKKLSNAYCDKFNLLKTEHITDECEFMLTTTARRKLIINTAMLQDKATRNTQGIIAMTIKKNHTLIKVEALSMIDDDNLHKYRTHTLPSAGVLIKIDDEQLKLI